MRHTFEGEEQLLENKYKDSYKCYMCNYNNINEIHTDKKHKNYHQYKIAKYILVTGSNKDIIKVKLKDAVSKFSSPSNKNGEQIKILIGTEVIKEGVDFKNIRQLFILDMWYNKGWYDQIIGRAARYCSHIDLDSEYRNVTIFNLATSLIKSKNKIIKYTETDDERRYRKTEIKDYKNKMVENILKRTAIDCIQNKNKNIIDTNKDITQISSNGDIYKIKFKDIPYSPECGYQKECNYKCIWEPKSNKDIIINTNTYDLFFNKIEKDNIIEEINKLYKLNYIYTIDEIIKFVKKKLNNIEDVNIYKIIDIMITKPKKSIITDKYMREGYLIYRGRYYIFQPLDLKDETIPMYYRKTLFTNKTKKVSLDLLNDFINENTNDVIVDTKKIYNKIFNNIKINFKRYDYLKKYDKSENNCGLIYSLIQNIILKEDINNIIIFLKEVISNFIINNNKNKLINDIIFYIDTTYLIKYDRDLKMDKVNKNNNIYGFYILDNYFHYNIKTKKWNTASTDIIYKVKTIQQYKNNKNMLLKNNNIMGLFIKNKKNKIQFKIMDNSLYTNVLTQQNKISKRSLITGRTCGTINIKDIYIIHSKLNLDKHKTKKNKNFLCNEIEIYLYINEYNKTDNKKWFINKII